MTANEAKNPFEHMSDLFLTGINFSFGFNYLQQNIWYNYQNISNFRHKFFWNMLTKIKEGKIKSEEINELIKFALKKELEMLQIDDESISKINLEYRKRFFDSYIKMISGDTKTLLNFSENFYEEQFWAEKGRTNIRENIRSEYGLDVSSEKIYETKCLKLLKINPIYQKGEDPTDFKYTEQAVVWFPPTVLDHHIISLLPNYGMSLVHHLAKFHPSYVVILKDYQSETILKMTQDDLVINLIKVFEFLSITLEQKPIFGGYCQGGTIAILASLTERLRPYIKAVFAAVAPTSKNEQEDIGPMTMVFEDLELVGEMIDGQLMIGKEFLSIGLKKPGWSAGSDLVKKMLMAKKDRELIRKKVEEGLTKPEAKNSFSQEKIKELAIELWLESMRHVPFSTTKMTLPIFKEGILSDGTYNLKLLGETIDVNNFNKRNLPLRLFFGKYDKVVPSESARAIADYVQDCKIYEFPGGHIDMCTKFDKGFQTPIIEEVEKIAKL